MSNNYTKATQLMEYIDSKNTHGRKTILEKLVELGLEKSSFFTHVQDATTNIGKNQLKFIWLDSFISNLKD